MSGKRARSLHELISVLEAWPVSAFSDHLKRKDISRWIADVFGDYPLAATVEKIENEYATEKSADSTQEISRAIRTRYDFVDPLSDLRDEPSPSLPP